MLEGSRTDCHCKVKVLRPVTLHWLDARHGRSSEKRSSPLISAGVQSSEGLCYSHRLLCILMASALYRPTRMRLCTNLPQRFAVSANDSCRIAFGQRTQRPSHVTFLRNVTFAYALMPDKAGHRFQRSRSAAKRFSAGGLCPWLQIFRPLTVESNPSQPPHGRCHNGWAVSCF